MVRRDDGLELAVGDGGALPWLGALLSDRRERLVVTGLGIELLVKLFDGSSRAAVSSSPQKKGTDR